ncbi:MAG: hypothetical protein ACYDD4_14215, partial [Acidimicrobiales bacterium]
MPRRVRASVTTTLVFVLGCAVAMTAFFVARSVVSSDEGLLLKQDAAQGSWLLGSYLGQVPAPVTSLGNTVGTNGTLSAPWSVSAADAMKQTGDSGMALLRVEGGRLVVVESAGTLHRDFGTVADTPIISALSMRSAPYDVSVDSGGRRWAGEAYGQPTAPKGFALYVESPLTTTLFSLATLPGHPFSHIAAAVYIGSERASDLLITTTEHLPLTGQRAVTIISGDATQTPSALQVVLTDRVGAKSAPGALLLVMGRTGPLAGAGSVLLPWVMLLGGLLSTLVVTGVVAMVERRRKTAQALAQQLESRNADLDLANTLRAQSDARFAAMVRSSSDLTTL